MKKFNVTLDRKTVLWVRHTVKIEANSLEEAQNEVKELVESNDFDGDVEIIWETEQLLTTLEAFTLCKLEQLIPDHKKYDTSGYTVIDFEEDLNFEV